MLTKEQAICLNAKPGDQVDPAVIETLLPFIENHQRHGTKLLNLKLTESGEKALKDAIKNYGADALRGERVDDEVVAESEEVT